MKNTFILGNSTRETEMTVMYNKVQRTGKAESLANCKQYAED